MLEIADGLQVPATPLSDVPGSAGTADPEQNAVGIENVGTTGLLMVTFSVKVDAHEVEGVKT